MYCIGIDRGHLSVRQTGLVQLHGLLPNDLFHDDHDEDDDHEDDEIDDDHGEVGKVNL